jgi:hypothetical protein
VVREEVAEVDDAVVVIEAGAEVPLLVPTYQRTTRKCVQRQPQFQRPLGK